jgi:hypothetical protein
MPNGVNEAGQVEPLLQNTSPHDLEKWIELITTSVMFSKLASVLLD